MLHPGLPSLRMNECSWVQALAVGSLVQFFPAMATFPMLACVGVLASWAEAPARGRG